MYQPIVLSGNVTFVDRGSLLFCFCGKCEKQLAWFPQGGARFKSTHCDLIYEAEPEDIELKRYVVMGSKQDATNVRPIRKPKPERMTFA